MPKTWVPSDKQRATVHTLASYGFPTTEIAKVVGVAASTLRKHCQHELDTAPIEANARVAQFLLDHATQGTAAANIQAAIFWLRTRARWRETPVSLEHSGPEGGPIQLAGTPEQRKAALDMALAMVVAFEPQAEALTIDHEDDAG
ncbi:MAG: hypothetical protein HQL37_01570 [Alphaproteobacteria bacterium]|nr:hypothetical protein [Alphaproteobacteria bacterium]